MTPNLTATLYELVLMIYLCNHLLVLSANLTHTALALSIEIVETRNVVARGCSEVNLEYFTAIKARENIQSAFKTTFTRKIPKLFAKLCTLCEKKLYSHRL